MAKVLLIFIGTVGAFIATGLTLSDIVNLNINLGIAFALSSGLFYALYLSLKRVAKKRKYSSGQITFNTFLFAIPWVAFIGVLLRNFSDNPLFVGLVVPNLYQWLLLFSFAIFSTILPYASLNFVNPKEIDPTTEGLLLLLDPVLHNLWAVVFFQQLVSPLQYMGVFLVLLVAAVNLKIL
ncbi:MAG: EamA family transporter [Candidatus Aenigmarchaeota archaeon]|nr:EamA family transporter [Candidatus Aenigmarchaeota archaeon]